MNKLVWKTCLLALLWASGALAAPFLVSDPNDTGVDEYVLECPGYVSITPAAADGSVYWDFDDWDQGKGWHDCTIKARASYAVEDMVTGITTTALKESNAVNIRIKIAPPDSSANHRIQE